MADSPLSTRSRCNTADSPGTGRIRSGPTVVRPQQVTEQSLMESVAGFINEVQSYNQPHNDPKCQILWAKFEETDINDPTLYPQNQDLNGNTLPLLLVLGYTQGVQVWCIQGAGEAQLVLSWFHGQVKCLKILPCPEVLNPFSDPFNPSRPLVAICDSSGPGTAFMSVAFISLSTGEQVSSIKFNNEIVDILANRRVVCLAFREKVAVFSALTFKERFTLTSCYPSPGVHVNPLALQSRWLAYADKTLHQSRRSSGGMEADGTQSTVTAWGINVGSKLASGVAKVCANIFSGAPKSTASQVPPVEGECGVVTVLDTVSLRSGEEEENNYDLHNQKMEGVVAHFVAHNKAIVALQFDPSGSLLLTADKPGNSFNIFRIVAHPLGSSYAAVHHLYSLYRGDTPGSVQDIAFSADARWVTVSTLRGTTHIFPICPYGGPVSVRTHTSHRVVNKLSRFHRSAGFNENPPAPSSGRNSPNPNLGSSPAANKSFDFPQGIGGSLAATNLAYPCPHLPPFPSPTVIQPVAQLRQPYIVTITSSVTLAGNRKNITGKKSSAPEENPIRVVAAFAPSRARMVPGLHSNTVYRTTKRAADSLFVMANHGQLLEYTLEPTHDQTIPREKVCESSPMELNVAAFGQWDLFKPVGKERSEVAPPLSSTNPLLLSRTMLSSPQDECWSEEDEDERWLSQVEILTHIGPARRLWMGPQFSFRPFQKPGEENELKDLDVTIACRPRSEPMQMPGGGMTTKKPVYIECGSANSFELSPRFANAGVRGSQEQVHLDLEKEINEAMSDTVNPKLKTPGELMRGEEFFCISTEDISRSRSGSSVSQSRSRHSSAIHRGVEMVTAESKIFSVAVQQGKSKELQNFVYKDMENQLIDRPVILSCKASVPSTRNLLVDSGDEFHPVFRDPTLLEDLLEDELPQGFGDLSPPGGQGDAASAQLLDEAVEDAPLQEQGDPDTILSEIQSAISQEEEENKDNEPKKIKKKKKGRSADGPGSYSSADEMKEVEGPRTRRKKGKTKEKEDDPAKTVSETAPASEFTAPLPVCPAPLAEFPALLAEFPALLAEFPALSSQDKKPDCWRCEDIPFSGRMSDGGARVSDGGGRLYDRGYKAKSSGSDLLNLKADEGSFHGVEDEEEKVEFFVRERSSSIHSELLETATRVNPYAAKPQQTHWLTSMLSSQPSTIEDQISGAARKYGDFDERDTSEDDEMKEFEKDKVFKEDTSPLLLEEEEVQEVIKHEDVIDKISHLLKMEYEENDEEFFSTVPSSKRDRKKKKVNAMEDSATDFEGWQEAAPLDPVEMAAVTPSSPIEVLLDVAHCAAVDILEAGSAEGAQTEFKDGWSFEIDEDDVNKLLSQSAGGESVQLEKKEERTALEDVFRFDSEMMLEEDREDRRSCSKINKGNRVSVEDLSDALRDETDSEAEQGTEVKGRWETSTDDESVSCGDTERPGQLGSSYPGTSSCSEGSATNSPWATKSKGKKNKKKKR